MHGQQLGGKQSLAGRIAEEVVVLLFRFFGLDGAHAPKSTEEYREVQHPFFFFSHTSQNRAALPFSLIFSLPL